VNSSSTFVDALRIALEHLGRSELFSHQLKSKLLQNGVGAQEAENVINQLVNWGYLDDDQVQESISDRLWRRSNTGPADLYAALIRRGVPVEEAEQLAESWMPLEVQRSRAEAILTKRLDSGDKPSAIIQYLGRKGFSTEILESFADRLINSD